MDFIERLVQSNFNYILVFIVCFKKEIKEILLNFSRGKVHLPNNTLFDMSSGVDLGSQNQKEVASIIERIQELIHDLP